MKKPWLLVLVFLLPTPLAAQEVPGYKPEERRVPRGEIGLFYEYERETDSELNIHGFGARFTLNATDWLAVETTLGIDPKRSTVPVRFIHQEFSGKLTYRQGRSPNGGQVGVFAFVGPGYINARAFGFSDTRPSLKWGAGVEYYPHRNVGFRIDVGDLVVFFPDDTTHSFILQPGISFRF